VDKTLNTVVFYDIIIHGQWKLRRRRNLYAKDGKTLQSSSII
jgi:hypothetical protein